MNRVILQLLVF